MSGPPPSSSPRRSLPPRPWFPSRSHRSTTSGPPKQTLPERPRRARRVAVTGGIGAGKSEALRAFERLGARVLSSDEVVHRLIEADPAVRSALHERFGTTDRARIAEIVFADPGELAWLEGLLHPRVRREYAAWLERLPETVGVAVVEIPLLYETGSAESFDAVVVITAPDGLRRARAGARVDERSGRLIPDDEKMQRADFTYVNEGTLAELEEFVERVLEELYR